MTLFFANHQITIIRNRHITGTNRFSLSATFTTYQADIQPATQQRVEFIQGRIGATFTAFVDADVDIKEGDYIQTEDDKRYAVKGVQRYQNAYLLDHLELLITSEDG